MRCKEIACNMDGQGLSPDRMFRSRDRQHVTIGWSCSLFVHGLVLAGAMALSGMVQLPPPAQPFRWDVALVKSSAHEAPLPYRQSPARRVSPSRMPHTIPSATKSSPSQAKPITTTPVQEVIQTLDQPIQHAVEHHVETVTTNVVVRQQFSRTTASQAVMSHATPITSAHLQETTPTVALPVRQAVLQRVQMATTNGAVRQESPQAMVSQTVTHETITPITRSEQGVARRPLQTHEGAQPLERATPLHGHAVARAIVSRAASSSSSQEVSTDSDYGWLAETLWKRVQALKRYPSKAAMDRIEGDVLLAAVVQADGVIAEVRVTESSGHPLLDQAAIEAVRSVSPLALLRPLDHAHVSVEIPIAYHGHN